MRQQEIETLADEALNEAVRLIQDKLGVQTGDFAGMYFDNDRWKVMQQVLAGYIVSEIIEGKQ
jgi:hypothetical protein